MSTVLFYCWKGRKEKKNSVPTDSNPVVIYDEAETVPTDSNSAVIYDEVKIDERVIDSFVPITDNPAYGTSLC